jgi:hypothetical protein
VSTTLTCLLQNLHANMHNFSLERPWVYTDPPPIVMTDEESEDGSADGSEEDQPRLVLPNADSSLGIGEDNVWLNAAQRDRNSR